MAEALPIPPGSPSARKDAAAQGLRLELVRGVSRPVELEVADAFLIGCVPGCDLRLPGTGLPPVICLISHSADGVLLRRLSPTYPIQVNGQTPTAAGLLPNDRLTVGPVELVVRFHNLCDNQESGGPVFVPLASNKTSFTEPPRASAAGGSELREREEVLERQQQELAALRQQHFEQYQQRRDRLAGMKEALDLAARKLQERKRELDAEAAAAALRRREDDSRIASFSERFEEVEQRSKSLDEVRTAIDGERESLRLRERQLALDRAAYEKDQTQFQADLVRLERARAAFELREKDFQDRLFEVERRAEQIQRDGQSSSERSKQLEEWQSQLRAEAELLAQQKAQLDLVTSQVAEREAAIQSQQASFDDVRAKLERLREELRTREQLLAEERARHQLAVEELDRQRGDLQRFFTEVEHERQRLDEERLALAEQNARLRTEVERYRPRQEAIDAEEARLKQIAEELEAKLKKQHEQDDLLEARAAQLLEMHERLTRDRQALREREVASVRAEQARESLQEQLRKRSEELNERQKALTDQARQRLEEVTALETRRVELEQEHAAMRERLAASQAELEQRSTELAARAADLETQQENTSRGIAKLREVARSAAQARKAFALSRRDWLSTQQADNDALARAWEELRALRQEMNEKLEQLPELELRAKSAADSLAAARSQLLAHLEELHTFARQRREDLEGLRGQVQEEAERVRMQALALHRARDEHRLAVAGFRQQLITWQGQVAELKRALANDETRLERRQAQVDEAVRAVDATSVRLTQQAEQLQEQEREVAVRRDEVDRHLTDMREWYRRKLRELAAGTLADAATAEGSQAAESPPSILTLTAEVEPGDRQLGELLQSLDLVDAETHTALLVEARRQRRSLRQVLLSSGHVTLYQLALIEAGNLDKLVLGPVRVVDRLRVTPHEAIYRVFDPRRAASADTGGNNSPRGYAVLRHLAEAEMEDAVRPDEYRQRFAAAVAVQHPNLAATLEVLEIAGRPAVLQEWVNGLGGADWAELVAAPGICYRLLCQAALALQTAHAAGLVHGGLDAAALVLTGDGTLKVRGLGEPAWLHESAASAAAARDDLCALGRLAQQWLASVPRPKLARPKQSAKALFELVERLAAANSDTVYSTAASFLEDLERIASDVPPNSEAWERLLRVVREGDESLHATRRSA